MKRSYNFGPDQAASIDTLASDLHIDKTDVITNGVRLFRQAVREARKGNQIGIIRDGQVVSLLVGPWSDSEPATA